MMRLLDPGIDASPGTGTSHARAPLPAVEFVAVTKAYHADADADADAVHALRDVSVQIRKGEIFGVIGHSGAGKSTFLRAINRLEPVTAGEVRVGGRNIATLDVPELKALRRKTGMVFQHFNLLSAKTVFQNVALPLVVDGWKSADIRCKVDAVLALVGLSDKKDAYPSQLSGGQKQRAGIARALVHDPELLLCDEATSALDRETMFSILRLLHSVRDALDLTIVLITHQIEVVREVCDRVAVLSKGEIVELGETWDVLGNTRSPVAKVLLHGEKAFLPHAVRQQIVEEAPEGKHDLILNLVFAGGTESAAHIGTALTALGTSARVIYGDIDNVQGRTFGRIVVAVPDDRSVNAADTGNGNAGHAFHDASAAVAADALRRARSIASHAEILGYIGHAA